MIFNMGMDIDTKRIRRMNRSKVLQFDCRGLNSPSLQWAQSHEDLRQAFSLVHQEYVRVGYLDKPDPSCMFFGIHNLLPETATLIVKSDGKAVATLTQVPDSKMHGLPMDKIFSQELDALRVKGRKIAELCSLATSSQLRWKNLFMQMSRIMYNHALANGINDFCIMVNPKHVAFYQLIFLFEQLGPTQRHPVLGVPAVALRVDINKAKERFFEKYGWLSTDCNLHDFLHQPSANSQTPSSWVNDLQPPARIGSETRAFFAAIACRFQNFCNCLPEVVFQ